MRHRTFRHPSGTGSSRRRFQNRRHWRALTATEVRAWGDRYPCSKSLRQSGQKKTTRARCWRSNAISNANQNRHARGRGFRPAGRTNPGLRGKALADSGRLTHPSPEKSVCRDVRQPARAPRRHGYGGSDVPSVMRDLAASDRHAGLAHFNADAANLIITAADTTFRLAAPTTTSQRPSFTVAVTFP